MESALASLDLSTLEQYRSEAISALHQLSLGRNIVSVGSATDQTTFTAADTKKLENYISQLTNVIATKEGKSGRGPIYLYPA